ncbi:MAG: diaminopimelate epimerase [Kofleriaceae bacterium]
MRFGKYHGLGNDFLVVDLRSDDGPEAALVQEPARAIALCDRQFGVGGDGVLAILPSAIADVRMVVLNSDGSVAEMCGNGIRCVAKYLFDRDPSSLYGVSGPRPDGLGPLGSSKTSPREIRIETGAGILTCAVDGEPGRAESISVRMGAPRLLRGEVPMTGPAGERCIEQPLEGAGAFTCVSTGNPHAVTFVDSREVAYDRARTLGPTLEHHAWFPRRTNVEFAHVKSRGELDLVVWERGCGLTLACGTGACATTVAAVLTGRADIGTPVRVNLPGGTLEITVLPEFADVIMKGPALHVFDAEIDIAALAARPTRQ